LPQKTDVKTKIVCERLRVRVDVLPTLVGLMAKIIKVTPRERKVAEVSTKYDPH
jgi:hypothetical protein